MASEEKPGWFGRLFGRKGPAATEDKPEAELPPDAPASPVRGPARLRHGAETSRTFRCRPSRRRRPDAPSPTRSRARTCCRSRASPSARPPAPPATTPRTAPSRSTPATRPARRDRADAGPRPTSSPSTPPPRSPTTPDAGPDREPEAKRLVEPAHLRDEADLVGPVRPGHRPVHQAQARRQHPGGSGGRPDPGRFRPGDRDADLGGRRQGPLREGHLARRGAGDPGDRGRAGPGARGRCPSSIDAAQEAVRDPDGRRQRRRQDHDARQARLEAAGGGPHR